MRVLIYTGLLLIGLIAPLASAQAPNNPIVDIPLVPVVGAEAEFYYTENKTLNGKPVSADLAVSMKILDVDKKTETFTVRWAVNSVTTEGMVIDKYHPLAGQMFIGFPYEYIAGYDGAPLKIKDKAKLIEQARQTELFKDKSLLERVIAILDSMTEEAIAEISFKPATYMSMCQASSLRVGEIVTSTGEVSNPFGGAAPIKVINNVELVSVDKSRKEALIRSGSKFDPESVKMVVEEFIRAAAPENKRKFSPEELRINREDRAECRVDTVTGWVKSFDYKVTVGDGSEQKVETMKGDMTWK